MKNIKNILILLIAGCILAACSQKTPPKPVHFRFISMIQYPSATLTIKGKGKNEGVKQSFPVSYGQPIGYKALNPGYYDIRLKVKGKTLLKRTYAFGKNSYYTLTSMGLLPKKWKVNPRTGLYQIKYLFAGEELVSANKYLPQWFVLRDNFDGSKSSAYIRFVNANPHTTKISIKKGKTSLLSKLAYPMESSMLKLKPGRHTLRVMYGKVQLGQKSITPKPGYVYTAIIGNKKDANDKLTIRILKNPSRMLLNTQQK